MERSACGGCAAPRLETILDLGSSPLADRFPVDTSPEKTYPLQLGFCAACGLAQLLHLAPDEELFGENYGFLTGCSPASINYFREWAQWALPRHRSRTRAIYEIACNDGTLLKNFQGTGNELLGIEPAMPAADHAREAGLEIEQELFTEESAGEILDQRGPAGLVIGCNVVAHVPDPVAFLRGIKTILAQDGIAILEFQSFADLLADNQFDLIYHEHRFFYSLTAFAKIAERAGLFVTAARHTPTQGGSLRVTLSRHDQGFILPESPGIEQARQFQGRADKARGGLLELLQDYKDQGVAVGGYGASAKSATLLNFCGIGPDLVQWVTDVTPSKIGKFTPGSHIPIIDEMKPAGAYVVFVRNYLASIMQREKAYLDAGGKFIVPLPSPVLL